MGMHAYGRTLRREGDLRLLALPTGAGCEWYCVCNGPTPIGTFRLLERSRFSFDAVCGAPGAPGAPGGPAAPGAPPGLPAPPGPGAPAGVTDLAAYRRRRAVARNVRCKE